MGHYNTSNMHETVYETLYAPGYCGDDIDYYYYYNPAERHATYKYERKLQKDYHCNKTCKLRYTQSTRFPTAEDMDLYSLAHGLGTKEWNPKYKPVVFSGSIFDLGSFGPWLIGWYEYFYGKNNTNVELLYKFTFYALQLSLHDEAIRECEDNTDDIVTKSLMRELRITANIGYLKIQMSIDSFLDLTDKDRTKTHLTQKAIKAFLDKYAFDEESVDELKAIIKVIQDWLDRLAVLAPHLC